MIEKHLTEVEIQNYLHAGSTDLAVKEHLKNCRACFHTYAALREALFMMRSGEPATAREEAAVLSMVRNQNRNHVRIMLRFLKDRVLVASSGQETLDFQGFEAAFSYRGNHLQGPISVTRKVGGRDVTVLLAPDSTGERFTVSVTLVPEESLEVSLFSEGTELELIPDLKKQNLFDSTIPSRGSCDLVFRKNSEEVFTVNLTLESDGGRR